MAEVRLSTVLCCIVYDSFTQLYAHINEQLLQLTACWL